MKTLLLLFALFFLCACNGGEFSRKQTARKAKGRHLIPENATYHFKNKFGDTLTLDKRRIPGFQHAVWIFRGDTLRDANNLDNTRYRVADGSPFRATFNETIDELLNAFTDSTRRTICLSNAELRTMFNKGIDFNPRKNYGTIFHSNGASDFFAECYIRQFQLDSDLPLEFLVEYDMAQLWYHYYVVYDFDGKTYHSKRPLALSNRDKGPDSICYNRKTKIIGLCEHGWGTSLFTQDMGLYQFQNDSLGKLIPAHPINGSEGLFDIYNLGAFTLNGVSGSWLIKDSNEITFNGNYTLVVMPDNQPEIYLIEEFPFKINYTRDNKTGRFKWKSGITVPALEEPYFSLLGEGELINAFNDVLRQNLRTGTPQQKKYISRYFKNKEKP